MVGNPKDPGSGWYALVVAAILWVVLAALDICAWLWYFWDLIMAVLGRPPPICTVRCRCVVDNTVSKWRIVRLVALGIMLALWFAVQVGPLASWPSGRPYVPRLTSPYTRGIDDPYEVIGMMKERDCHVSWGGAPKGYIEGDCHVSQGGAPNGYIESDCHVDRGQRNTFRR